MSNTAKFWIGVLLAIPVVLVGGVVVAFISGIASTLDSSGTAASILGSVTGFVELAVVVVAIVLPKTRWFALGVIAGLAVLAVLAAGACVVLLVAFSRSMS